MTEKTRTSLWPMARLGSIARVVGGSTPDSGNALYWGGDVVWLTPADLGKLKATHVHDSERHITPLGFRSASVEIVPIGSVVMSSRAPIGYLAINDVPLCTNQGCKSFIPGPSLDPGYLLYVLTRAVPTFRELGSGATFAEISKSKLEDYQIPLPPLAEQRRIAAKLDEQMATLARAQAALSAEREAATALRSAVLRTALDPTTRPAWPTTELRSLVTFANGLWTGKQPPFRQVKVIRNTNFTKECALDLSDVALLDVEEKQLSSRRLLPGDIILERSGGGPTQPVGRVALFELHDDVYSFSNFTSVMRALPNGSVLPRFLWYYLYYSYRSGATESLQNRTSGIRNLAFDDYAGLQIPVPAFVAQRQITKQLDDSMKQIDAVTASLDSQVATLDSLRASLLDAAFGRKV